MIYTQPHIKGQQLREFARGEPAGGGRGGAGEGEGAGGGLTESHNRRDDRRQERFSWGINGHSPGPTGQERAMHPSIGFRTMGKRGSKLRDRGVAGWGGGGVRGRGVKQLTVETKLGEE
jgi:hypothetical protein